MAKKYLKSMNEILCCENNTSKKDTAADDENLHMTQNISQSGTMELKNLYYGMTCAENLLLTGINNSDTKLFYNLNKILKTSDKNHCSLGLNPRHLVHNPEEPVYVSLDITDISSLFNSEILKNITEIRDRKHFLSLLKIKNLSILKINAEASKLDIGAKVSARSSKISCLSIQFDFTMFSVVQYLLTNLIELLNKLIKDIVKTGEIKSRIKTFIEFINKLLEKSHVTIGSWCNFQNGLTTVLDYKSAIRKYLENFFWCFQWIKEDRESIISYNVLSELILRVIQSAFSILIICGFSGIHQVIEKKEIPFVKKAYSGKRKTLTEKEIAEVLDVDMASISNDIINSNDEYLSNTFNLALQKASLQISLEIDNFSELLDEKKGDIYPIFKQLSKHWHQKLTMKKFDNQITGCSLNVILISELIASSLSALKTYLYNASPLPNLHNLEVHPCLKFVGWPESAYTWTARQRYWPSPNVIKKIIRNGFQVVFKSSPQGKSEYDGRISFHQAYTILYESLTTKQRNIMFSLKDILCTQIIDSKNLLKWQHLQTICFWYFESQPPTEHLLLDQNNCIGNIITNLDQALMNRKLPHYFIPEYNLFMNLTDGDCKILKLKLKRIAISKVNRPYNLKVKSYSEENLMTAINLNCLQKFCYEIISDYFEYFYQDLK